ncbi:hypothetical protein, partial [Klebsiella pneumoniae]|uniref:hypothetical protein n=1 Tax=Klebsiella pneumoniae TaxID=573 RepID=UPI003D357FE1
LVDWILVVSVVFICFKKKNRLGRRFFKVHQTGKFMNRGNWLRGAQSPNLFYQCSRIVRVFSRLHSSNQLPMAAASGAFACLTGLDSR